MLHPSNVSSLYNVVLVSTEQVAGIDLLLHIVQAAIVAVGNNGLAALLELVQIVDNLAAKEGSAILQSRLVDDHSGTLRLNALHDALDRALAEVVRVRLHGKTEDTDHNIVFLAGIVVLICLVCASNFQHTVGNVILAGTVGFHDGFNEVLRNICIVGKELLGIFRQAIAAVTKDGLL